MTRWTVSAEQGWLRFEDDDGVTAIEAVRVEAFGTFAQGFAVVTPDDRFVFPCGPKEARSCVDRLFALLAIP